MKIYKKISGFALTGILGAALLIICGCSSSTGPEFTLPVTISAKIETSSQSNVDYAVLVVVMEDNILLQDTLELNLGRVESVVEIPPGQNINFILNAYTSANVLIYGGSSIADVGLGEDIVVPIQMIPQVLMLKVDPLYLEFNSLAAGEQYIDIYVYNAIDLFGASFRINYLNNVITPTRVEFNSASMTNFLGNEVLSFARIENGYVAMSVVKLRGQNPVSGSGHLARIYFNLISEGNTSLAFDPETASLVDENEVPVANSTSLVLEDGELLIMLPIP